MCLSAFALCLASSLWFSSIGWTHNLHELHEFRQIQTALTARAIQQEGWSLAYPTPLFGPPWSVPLEFPLYQILVAKLSALTGSPLEQTGRIVSLTCLYLALPAFFLLLRQLQVSATRRWLFLALILATPLYLHYSRTFMIESVALCCAAWFLHAFCRAVETRGPAWIAAAALLGSAAALAKVTTFLVFLTPAAGLTLMHLSTLRSRAAVDGWRPFLRCAAISASVAGAALAVGLAWVLYSDKIKGSNPLTTALISSRMQDWNYGALGLRFDPNFWKALFNHSVPGLLRLGTFVAFLGALFMISRKARWQALSLVACFLVGPLVFANLYFLHDYYFYATGIFLLAAVVVVWNQLLDLPWLPNAATYALIGIALGAQVLGFTNTYFHVQNRGDEQPPELGLALGAVTEPADVLLVYGLEWNPILPYVAGRKAIMVTDEHQFDEVAQDEVFRRLPNGTITAVVFSGAVRNNHPLRERLVRRFDLTPDPLVRSTTANLHVAKRRLPLAARRVAAANFRHLALDVPPDAEYNGTKLRRYRVTDLPNPDVVATFSPRPTEIMAPFGVSVSDIEGESGLNAHAPTFVTVDIPDGARTVEAQYGLVRETYVGEHRTDGVTFQIELLEPSGSSRLLFEKRLNPASEFGDRKRQTLKLDLPPGATGLLVFRTLPGPANNLTFDWSYWINVKVR